MVNKILHSLYPVWLCRIFRGTNFSGFFFSFKYLQVFFQTSFPSFVTAVNMLD